MIETISENFDFDDLVNFCSTNRTHMSMCGDTSLVWKKLLLKEQGIDYTGDDPRQAYLDSIGMSLEDFLEMLRKSSQPYTELKSDLQLFTRTTNDVRFDFHTLGVRFITKEGSKSKTINVIQQTRDEIMKARTRAAGIAMTYSRAIGNVLDLKVYTNGQPDLYANVIFEFIELPTYSPLPRIRNVYVNNKLIIS